MTREQKLCKERDEARRKAVHLHFQLYPDCEDKPDILRSLRHIAVGIFGLSYEDACLLFPKEA